MTIVGEMYRYAVASFEGTVVHTENTVQVDIDGEVQSIVPGPYSTADLSNLRIGDVVKVKGWCFTDPAHFRQIRTLQVISRPAEKS